MLLHLLFTTTHITFALVEIKNNKEQGRGTDHFQYLEHDKHSGLCRSCQIFISFISKKNKQQRTKGFSVYGTSLRLHINGSGDCKLIHISPYLLTGNSFSKTSFIRLRFTSHTNNLLIIAPDSKVEIVSLKQYTHEK